MGDEREMAGEWTLLFVWFVLISFVCWMECVVYDGVGNGVFHGPKNWEMFFFLKIGDWWDCASDGWLHQRPDGKTTRNVGDSWAFRVERLRSYDISCKLYVS